jgi:hypothetical protein
VTFVTTSEKAWIENHVIDFWEEDIAWIVLGFDTIVMRRDRILRRIAVFAGV